jgi:putative oxidoreductase
MRSRRSTNTTKTDAALLILRAVPGTLVAAHGAQKVFGVFAGPGLAGTTGFMHALRMRPPRIWGPVAGLSELVGGGLTAVGALSPAGPITAMAPMFIASTTAHWGKPIWATHGGAELPLTNMSAFAALALLGPGRWSVDGALGIRLPRWLVAATGVGVAAGVVVALVTRTPEQPQQPAQAEPEPEAMAEAAASSQEREVELRASAAAASRGRVEAEQGA